MTADLRELLAEVVTQHSPAFLNVACFPRFRGVFALPTLESKLNLRLVPVGIAHRVPSPLQYIPSGCTILSECRRHLRGPIRRLPACQTLKHVASEKRKTIPRYLHRMPRAPNAVVIRSELHCDDYMVRVLRACAS